MKKLPLLLLLFCLPLFSQDLLTVSAGQPAYEVSYGLFNYHGQMIGIEFPSTIGFWVPGKERKKFKFPPQGDVFQIETVNGVSQITFQTHAIPLCSRSMCSFSGTFVNQYGNPTAVPWQHVPYEFCAGEQECMTYKIEGDIVGTFTDWNGTPWSLTAHFNQETWPDTDGIGVPSDGALKITFNGQYNGPQEDFKTIFGKFGIFQP